MTSMLSPCPSAPGSSSWGCSPSQQRRTRKAMGSPGFPERSQSLCSVSSAPATAECPSRILTGSYEEAGARLQEALRPTQSEAARARRGLLRLKKGDVPAAARDLQCLAEKDAGDLSFLLRLLEASERQSLAQVGGAPHGAPTPGPPQRHGRGVGGGRGGGTQVWPSQAQGDSVIGTQSSGDAVPPQGGPHGVSSKERASWGRPRLVSDAGRTHAMRPLPGDETDPEVASPAPGGTAPARPAALRRAGAGAARIPERVAPTRWLGPERSSRRSASHSREASWAPRSPATPLALRAVAEVGTWNRAPGTEPQQQRGSRRAQPHPSQAFALLGGVSVPSLGT